tara:strand:- start:245 stop:481 length:237 start_codon:yes stop_codon:yes gene_type:complete
MTRNTFDKGRTITTLNGAELDLSPLDEIMLIKYQQGLKSVREKLETQAPYFDARLLDKEKEFEILIKDLEKVIEVEEV